MNWFYFSKSPLRQLAWKLYWKYIQPLYSLKRKRLMQKQIDTNRKIVQKWEEETESYIRNR